MAASPHSLNAAAALAEADTTTAALQQQQQQQNPTHSPEGLLVAPLLGRPASNSVSPASSHSMSLRAPSQTIHAYTSPGVGPAPSLPHAISAFRPASAVYPDQHLSHITQPHRPLPLHSLDPGPGPAMGMPMGDHRHAISGVYGTGRGGMLLGGLMLQPGVAGSPLGLHSDGGPLDLDDLDPDLEPQQYMGHHGVLAEELDCYRSMSPPPGQPCPGVEIFVGGLTRSSTRELLYDCFSHIGDITEVRIARDKRRRRCRGYGFVRFRTSEQANMAVESMQAFQFKRGCFLSVLPSDENRTLYACGIEEDVSPDAVCWFLTRSFEGIKRIHLMWGKEDVCKLRPFCFIEFHTNEQAAVALLSHRQSTGAAAAAGGSSSGGSGSGTAAATNSAGSSAAPPPPSSSSSSTAQQPWLDSDAELSPPPPQQQQQYESARRRSGDASTLGDDAASVHSDGAAAAAAALDGDADGGSGGSGGDDDAAAPNITLKLNWADPLRFYIHLYGAVNGSAVNNATSRSTTYVPGQAGGPQPPPPDGGEYAMQGPPPLYMSAYEEDEPWPPPPYKPQQQQQQALRDAYAYDNGGGAAYGLRHHHHGDGGGMGEPYGLMAPSLPPQHEHHLRRRPLSRSMSPGMTSARAPPPPFNGGGGGGMARGDTLQQWQHDYRPHYPQAGLAATNGGGRGGSAAAAAAFAAATHPQQRQEPQLLHGDAHAGGGGWHARSLPNWLSREEASALSAAADGGGGTSAPPLRFAGDWERAAPPPQQQQHEPRMAQQQQWALQRGGGGGYAPEAWPPQADLSAGAQWRGAAAAQLPQQFAQQQQQQRQRHHASAGYSLSHGAAPFDMPPDPRLLEDNGGARHGGRTPHQQLQHGSAAARSAAAAAHDVWPQPPLHALSRTPPPRLPQHAYPYDVQSSLLLGGPPVSGSGRGGGDPRLQQQQQQQRWAADAAAGGAPLQQQRQQHHQQQRAQSSMMRSEWVGAQRPQHDAAELLHSGGGGGGGAPYLRHHLYRPPPAHDYS